MSAPEPPSGAPAAELADLRRLLELEETRRRGRERELVEQTARTRDAEARLEAVRQTMAFGLGQALVDALKLPGLLALPRRIVELRRRQQEKRGWQRTHAVEQRAADDMRLVEPAKRRAREQGVEVAAKWVEGHPGRLRRQKARALVELALGAVDAPALAAAIGARAARLAPEEPALVSLALRLREQGTVTHAAALFARIADEHLAPGARLRRIAIDAEAALLGARVILPARGPRPEGVTGTAILASRSGPRDRDGVAARAERSSGGAHPIITPPGYGGAPAPAPDRYWRLPGCGVPPEALESYLAAAAPLYADAIRSTGAAQATLVLGDLAIDLAAAAGARLAGVPLSVEIGWLPAALFDPPTHESCSAAEAGLRLLLSCADRIVARGPAFAARLETMGIRSEIMIAPPAARPSPLPVADAEALRRELRVPEGRVLLACPGMIDEDPGLVLLARWAAAQAGVTVLFCGAGPGMPGLVREVAALGGREAAVFTGALPADQRIAAMRVADAIVVPHQREGAIASDPDIAIDLLAGLGALVLSAEAWRWRTIPERSAGVTIAVDEATLGRALSAIAGQAREAAQSLSPGFGLG